MNRMRKKALLVVVVFSYLLMGMAGPYSFVWCFEENGTSHLEFGIVGTCRLLHHAGCNDEKGVLPPSLSFANSAISCIDVPFLSVQGRSQSPASSQKNLLPYSQAPVVCFLWNPEKTTGRSTVIPEPPFSCFALKALGTVVLLI